MLQSCMNSIIHLKKMKIKNNINVPVFKFFLYNFIYFYFIFLKKSACLIWLTSFMSNNPRQKLIRIGSKANDVNSSIVTGMDEVLLKLLEKGNIEDVEKHILGRHGSTGNASKDEVVFKLIVAQRKIIEKLIFENANINRGKENAKNFVEEQIEQRFEKKLKGSEMEKDVLKKIIFEKNEEIEVLQNRILKLEKENEKLQEENYNVKVAHFSLECHLKALLRNWELEYQKSVYFIEDDDDDNE